jgi:hypothetical protein
MDLGQDVVQGAAASTRARWTLDPIHLCDRDLARP